MSFYDAEPEEPRACLNLRVICNPIEGKISRICKNGATPDELLLETGLSLPS